MKSSQVKQGLRATVFLLALVLLASTAWFSAPRAAQAYESEFYSATLTVGKESFSNFIGFDRVGGLYGTLSSETFSHDGTTYMIESLYHDSNLLYFRTDSALSTSLRNVLTLTVGETAFTARAAHVSSNLYTWNTSLSWSAGDTVTVKMSVTVRVAKPSGFGATAGVNQVTLSWNESGDATITGYQVQRDGGDWTDITGSGRSTTGHTVTGLDNGTEYSFAIRAVNRAGNGVVSDTVTATPFVSPVLTLSADSTAVSEDPAASIESNAPDNPGEKVTVTVTLDPAPTGGNRYEDCNLRAAATGSSAGVDDYFIPAEGKHLIKRFGWTQTFNFWVIDDALDDDDETLVLEAFCTGRSAGNPPPVAAADLPTTQLTFTIADNDEVAPAQPTGFTATAGDGQVTLGWSDPDDGTITRYEYRESDDGGSNWDPDWTAIPGSGAATTSYTVTGLTNGTEYSFQIRAVNGIGEGAESATKSATPQLQKPEPPTNFTATAGDTEVTLSWADPSNVTITSYEVQQDGGGWVGISGSDASTTSYTVTGLTNGTQYTFQIRAVSNAGNGKASDAVTLTLPIGGTWSFETDLDKEYESSLPANTVIAGGDGVDIFSVNAIFRVADADVDEVSALSVELTGDGDRDLRFSVPATNPQLVGFDDGSEELSPTFVYDIRLDREFDCTRAGGAITCELVPSSIIYFLIAEREATPGDYPVTVDVLRELTLTATVNNQHMTAITPTDADLPDLTLTVNEPPPAKPSGLTATAGDTQVTLSWTDPSNGTITGYEVQQDGGGWVGISGSDASTTSYTVTGLTNGTQYTFQIRAVNNAGSGSASDRVITTPGRVTIWSATISTKEKV